MKAKAKRSYRKICSLLDKSFHILYQIVVRFVSNRYASYIKSLCVLYQIVMRLALKSFCSVAFIVFINFSLLSCIDTSVLPNDKIIEEYYWQTKEDVAMAVSGAYLQMISKNVIDRLIIWGELRSDEVYVNTTPTGTVPTALQEINVADIQTSNTYSDWASLYAVINTCNVVLSHAEQVMSIDPSYAEGDYLWDKAQMLALRALCHFYLVRTFRDIPYNKEAFTASSQELQISQVSPSIALQYCIDDLIEARKGSVSSSAFTDWQRVGRLTTEAIDAILADVYLWRASMMHNEQDYEQCAECCERVILSLQEQYPKDEYDDEALDYPLVSGADHFNEVFIEGNSKEAIFELQFDDDSNTNTSICQNYYKYSSSALHGYLYASSIFTTYGTDYVYTKNTDYRYWYYTYDVGSTTLEDFDVRKMVTQNTQVLSASSLTAFKHTSETRSYSSYAQNWIVYRLSDVMLMEAEARVQLATDDNDIIQLEKAFDLVNVVNLRSQSSTSNALSFADYGSRDAMEVLVLEERQRELCYEGKRWFDLMRYNYRHLTETNCNAILADMELESSQTERTNQSFLDLIIRKFKEGGSGVTSKMRSESSLYMPIYESEIKVNGNLKQNPNYQ